MQLDQQVSAFESDWQLGCRCLQYEMAIQTSVCYCLLICVQLKTYSHEIFNREQQERLLLLFVEKQ